MTGNTPSDRPSRPTPGPGGTLGVVFGDQLDARSALLRLLVPGRDLVVMVEVAGESTHVPSHVQRTVLFLSAMRHFADELRSAGHRVWYVRLGDPDNTHSLESEIARAIQACSPARLASVQPGEWRVLRMLERVAAASNVTLDVLPDEHFIATDAEFAAWAKGRSSLTMEFFYRQQRRKTGYLMDGDAPEGGRWNFDASNRESFGRGGPSPRPPTPRRFEPDAITLAVIEDVRRLLPDLPGNLNSAAGFGWGVTRRQALAALKDFVDTRLPLFGKYEDAMWSGEAFVYHSALSPALNLKLLDPRECCEAAIEAYLDGRAPLESVEAFVRQLIGWREFVRGVYWLEGDGYAERNGLDAHGRLPEFYWTGRTGMKCLENCVGNVVENGYAHHIQRLMIMGNFALIAGVHPRAVSDWYLGMFVDGVDWVTLPNALGMVMHADRRADAPASETGLVGTKPYAASANYIGKMSNYCASCAYDPKAREGERACPFNVFYWDFLIRHRERLGGNHRMAMINKNADRLTHRQRVQITVSAGRLRQELGIDGGPTNHATQAEGLYGAAPIKPRVKGRT